MGAHSTLGQLRVLTKSKCLLNNIDIIDTNHQPKTIRVEKFNAVMYVNSTSKKNVLGSHFIKIYRQIQREFADFFFL